MRERLCEVIADKDSCGVEDHLATCKVYGGRCGGPFVPQWAYIISMYTTR